MRVTVRYRINARIPDKDDKYRDEITQEITLEDDYDLEHMNFPKFVEQVKAEADKVKHEFYAEINRLGGYDYREIT
jgi:hypothetical protein